MYTDSLGPWARNIFVIGAIVVLYSTLLAALAAWTRMFSDAFGRVGWYDFHNEKSRKLAISILAWLIPTGWATLFIFMQKDPGFMVILGGLATVVILLIVVFASLYFRYQRNDPRLLPHKAYDIWLWASSVAIFLVAVFALYRQVLQPLQSMVAQ